MYQSELLGEVVTWDMRSQELPLATVNAALKAADIEADLPELSARSAFGRACKTLRENRAIDKLDQDANTVHFQLTHKDVDASGASYTYEAKVSVDKEKAIVSCPESYAIQVEAQNLVNHALGHRTAQDVTRLVQKLFTANADLFAINPRKGVAYFVPEEHREFTAKVDDFLKGLGGELWRFPVPKGTEQGNESVRDAVKAGLDAMVTELNAAVESWEKDKTRPTTMLKAWSRWEAISHKVDCYAVYLEAEKDRLGESLTKAKQALSDRIAELTGEDTAGQVGAPSESLESVEASETCSV